MAIKLVIGLGNPGTQYEKTRHNVGFWLIELLAREYNVVLREELKFKGLYSKARILNTECMLLMPVTFMNLSGEAVYKISNFYKIQAEEILVVHDELDFIPGIVRLKQGGGANGHNGVQHIINQLGNNNFWRLRIGIGKPTFKADISTYVLAVPDKLVTQQIHNTIKQAVAIIPALILGNFGKAMQILHEKTQ